MHASAAKSCSLNCLTGDSIMAKQTTTQALGLSISWTMLFWTVSTIAASENSLDKRFEAARDHAIRLIEKRLATPGGGTDDETWYVIIFRDRAVRGTPTSSISLTTGTLYVSTEARQFNRCVRVQGRAAAARMIYQFCQLAPQAVQDLSPTARIHQTAWAKTWEYRAFKSRLESEAVYNSLMGRVSP